MDTSILFKGVATAVVTPFKEEKIDLAAFEGLLDRQLSAGVSALVVCGTTGESATLSHREWREVISFAADFTKGRAQVIAGCGSNSTTIAENKASEAEKAGADALLCVTPYYNKANVEGLIYHFKKVAEATPLPLILYNVPQRTGIDVPTEVYEKLTETENILGIKEASGDVAKSAGLISQFKDRYLIYSGSDEVNLPILSLGGAGVISVLSNIVPEKVVRLCNLAFAENYKDAAVLSAELYPLAKALFYEVNPIPIKTALAEIGVCRADVRPPLYRISDKSRALLIDVMKKAGLI